MRSSFKAVLEFFFFNRDRKFYDSPILFIFNLNKNFGNTLPNIPFSLKTTENELRLPIFNGNYYKDIFYNE